jgi:hypothetical protein
MMTERFIFDCGIGGFIPDNGIRIVGPSELGTLVFSELEIFRS